MVGFSIAGHMYHVVGVAMMSTVILLNLCVVLYPTAFSPLQCSRRPSASGGRPRLGSASRKDSMEEKHSPKKEVEVVKPERGEVVIEGREEEGETKVSVVVDIAEKKTEEPQPAEVRWVSE